MEFGVDTGHSHICSEHVNGFSSSIVSFQSSVWKCFAAKKCPVPNKDKALLYALADRHRGNDEFYQLVATDMNCYLQTIHYNAINILKRELNPRVYHQYTGGSLKALQAKGSGVLRPGLSSADFELANTYRRTMGLEGSPCYLPQCYF